MLPVGNTGEEEMVKVDTRLIYLLGLIHIYGQLLALLVLVSWNKFELLMLESTTNKKYVNTLTTKQLF